MTGDGRDHPYRLTFDPSRDLSGARIYDDLETFDRDIATHGSLPTLIDHLDGAGQSVIGFTWNVIFETELDILASRRPAYLAPSHLGTECLMWWRRPSVSLSAVSVELSGRE
jgi:hypothetical protein